MFHVGKRPHAHIVPHRGKCRRLYAVLFAMVLVVTGAVAPAYATTVNVVVHDSLPGALTITSPAPDAIITDPSLIVTGTVHNISQIMAYLDTNYVSTMPVDAGAATFSLAIPLTPVLHQLRLVGIDSYNNTQVEQALSLTYIPDQTATPPTDSTPTVVQSGAATIEAGKEAAREQIAAASSEGPMKTLTDGAYTVLTTLGLISPTDKAGPTQMSLRFLVAGAGVMLLMAPWAILAAGAQLHLVSSQVLTSLQGNKWLRVVGLGLMVVPFVFLP